MDAVGTIDATALGSSSASTATSRASAFGALDSEEFVKIIFAELGNQDPLAPTDSKALLDQLASLRSIQSDIDMQSRLKSLVSDNEFAAASGLIGQRISGDNATGIVRSASRTSEGVFLNLMGGARVAMSRVESVGAASGRGS